MFPFLEIRTNPLRKKESADLPYIRSGPRKPIYPYGEACAYAHTPIGYIMLAKSFSSSRFDRIIEQIKTVSPLSGNTATKLRK